MMKWSYSRMPDCFHCRHFIGWPYCRFFRDGIPADIQDGANSRCGQYTELHAAHASILVTIRDRLFHRLGKH